MLVKNMVIKYFGQKGSEDRLERILWLAQRNKYVIVFDINDKRALPVRREASEIVDSINAGDAIIIARDERFYFQAEEAYSEKQRQGRDKNWILIKHIVQAEKGAAIFERQKRGILIEQAAAESGQSKRLIYEKLRRYWRYGQIKNALIPRFDQSGLGKSNGTGEVKRGRPRLHSRQPGMNIDPKTKKLLLKGYKRFYISRRCKTLTEAHQKTLETFFSVGETVDSNGVALPKLPHRDELPTLAQFKYHCHQPRDRMQVLSAREGQSRIEANLGPKLGSAAQMAFGPGSWAFIDSTPADCNLVSSINRANVLGKPQLYFVKDLFSYMIMGFMLSLEEASWMTQILAIQNTAANKVSYCNRYGITIQPKDWPCHYLPEFLLGDRGEMESEAANNLVNILGVQVSNTPPYRPNKKGPVELDFHLLNHYTLHKLPGGGPPPAARGAKDHRGIPSVTLVELTYVVIHYILFYNKTHILQKYPFDEYMLADGVSPVPISLWNWGIENRGRHFRVISEEVVYRSLLPRAGAKVTRHGIEFKGLHYFIVD